MLSKLNEKITLWALKIVFIQYKCECDRQYIGATEKPLNIQISKQKNNMRLRVVDKS